MSVKSKLVCILGFLIIIWIWPFQTIERDDLNEAFYGGTQQEAVLAEVIDGHKLIDLENVVFDW